MVTKVMSEPFRDVDACELGISIKGFSGKQQVGLAWWDSNVLFEFVVGRHPTGRINRAMFAR
jgi:hypothetical protein